MEYQYLHDRIKYIRTGIELSNVFLQLKTGEHIMFGGTYEGRKIVVELRFGTYNFFSKRTLNNQITFIYKDEE